MRKGQLWDHLLGEGAMAAPVPPGTPRLPGSGGAAAPGAGPELNPGQGIPGGWELPLASTLASRKAPRPGRT